MQNRSLKPDETHWEGSFGQAEQAYLANATPRLGAPSTESNELTKLIRQTYMRVTHNATKADALLREYKKNMGEPFSSQEDNIPKRTIPGLASPEMQRDEWTALSNAERLLQNYTAYAVIPAHLDVVLDWQKDLNPGARQLIELLESVKEGIRALLNNLESLMKLKDTPVLQPKPSKLTASNVLEQKLLGYNVCWLYHLWLKRSLEDLNKLTK